MKVALFVPCFVDAIYPQAALAAAEVLESLGCEVSFPEDQICCGQPPFNSGDWETARIISRRQLQIFAGTDPIVALSGSCGAMMKIFNPELFHGQPEESLARQVASRTHEFSNFLVNVLKVEDVGASLPARATFHDGCHGLRELGLKQPPRRLLAHVRGLELVEMAEAETCCGFGGTFAVKFSMISTAMGEVKCDAIAATGADIVVSNDASCLMQISAMLERQGRPRRCMHLAEVLASRS